MAYIIACLTASSSFLINRALLNKWGTAVIVSWGPFVEETLKTLLSYWLGADILAAHAAFGVLEGLYDWQGSGRNGPRAAVLSVVGHTLFGAITVFGLWLTAKIEAGLLAGVVTHLLWNMMMVKIFSAK